MRDDNHTTRRRVSKKFLQAVAFCAICAAFNG